MLIGVGLPVAGGWATPENIRHIAVRAEEFGYASLWTFQRLLQPVDVDLGLPYGGVLDPIPALSYAAGITSRIRLGVGVVNMPFYAPVVVSKALTTLDIVSEGRLDVGLGLGWAPQEFAAVGVSAQARGARAEEYVNYLKAVWTQDEVEFHGAFYDLPRCRVDPKPVQKPHPPVLMGGSADVALRRIGRIADGWISSSRADLTTIGRSITTVRQAAVRAGRDPDRLRFVVRGVVRLIADDVAHRRPADDVANRRPLQGTAEEIRADLGVLANEGVTEVFLDCNYDPRIAAAHADPGEGRKLADEVLTEFAAPQ